MLTLEPGQHRWVEVRAFGDGIWHLNDLGILVQLEGGRPMNTLHDGHVHRDVPALFIRSRRVQSMMHSNAIARQAQ